MTDSQKKAQLRLRALAARAALTDGQRAERDERLCEILKASPLISGASCVYLYAAVRGEIDLSPLARELARRGVPLAYPITERAGVMHFRLAEPRELIPGRFGIPEPSAACPVPTPDSRSVCLGPALAYDEDGYRIGYGGGYYDRFLVGFCGISIGIADKISEKPIPHETHDLAVNYLLCEDGIRKIPDSSEVKR